MNLETITQSKTTPTVVAGTGRVGDPALFAFAAAPVEPPFARQSKERTAVICADEGSPVSDSVDSH